MNKKQKRQKLIKALLNLPKTAEEQNWSLYYDKELDNLYFSPQTIPEGSILENINKEIAVYVTPELNVAGIFIEYFSKNFVKHKKSYGGLLELLKKGDETIKEIDKRKIEKAKLYEKALITETLKNLPESQAVYFA